VTALAGCCWRGLQAPTAATAAQGSGLDLAVGLGWDGRGGVVGGGGGGGGGDQRVVGSGGQNRDGAGEGGWLSGGCWGVYLARGRGGAGREEGPDVQFGG